MATGVAMKMAVTLAKGERKVDTWYLMQVASGFLSKTFKTLKDSGQNGQCLQV